jgi:hypothetical protein
MVFVLKSTKFRRSLPYTGRSQVIDIRPVYTSNIPYVLTQFNPIILGLNPTNIIIHINHNVYDIHCTTIIIVAHHPRGVM